MALELFTYLVSYYGDIQQGQRTEPVRSLSLFEVTVFLFIISYATWFQSSTVPQQLIFEDVSVRSDVCVTVLYHVGLLSALWVRFNYYILGGTFCIHAQLNGYVQLNGNPALYTLIATS